MNNTKNIINACNILFGPKFKFNPSTLDYIQLSGIKSAYKEKSKLYHPDRSYVRGIDANILAEYFKELNKAYNVLLNYKKINAKKNNIKIKPNFKTKTSFRYNFYYKGVMPKRELRFGEFLYYSRKICWNDLIASIVKQSIYRGKIGRICLELKYINKVTLCKIINQKKEDEKFGESAIRLGYLDIDQLNTALYKQKSKKYPIGRYFIDNNIISTEDLNRFLQENRKYNIKMKKAALKVS
jgi:hypothetical protein